LKKTEIDYAKQKKRNERWYNLLISVIDKPVKRMFEMPDEHGELPEGANLILANHVMAADPFLIARYYGKHHIYFVAGENVVSNPLLKWLIFGTIGLIVHMRGVSSLNTIKEMTRHLKRGDTVEIFPEGSTTFDGRTRAVDASIAKVAKVSGCNLVLTKLEGGYLAAPRWGKSHRRGRVRLSDHIILKDDLAKMSVEEVVDSINTHLYTDAYEVQERDPARYKSRKRGLGLESCIYGCPSCKKITGLKSSATKLFCKCGYEAEYDEYGYLTQKDGQRHTLTELCNMQREQLLEAVARAKSSAEKILLFEDEFHIKKIYADTKRIDIGNVKVSAYADYAEYNYDGITGRIDYSDVQNVFIFRRNKMTCHVAGRDYGYEMQGDFSSNALKYRELFEILKKK